MMNKMKEKEFTKVEVVGVLGLLKQEICYTNEVDLTHDKLIEMIDKYIVLVTK